MNKRVTKSIEDYLKTIYILTEEKGITTTTEISSALHVQPPSVTEMIQKMEKRGFVSHEKYRGIMLTEKGRELARNVYERNETIFNFLKIIGVEEKIAEDDACKIEHDLNSVTVGYLTRFVEFVQTSPQNPRWLEHFRYYRETGKHKKCEREVVL